MPFWINKMKVGVKANLKILLFTILLTSTPFLNGCDDLSEQDKSFITKIEQKFIKDGSPIFLSEIHQGNWAEVCPILEYERVSKIAAGVLNINPEQVDIINTYDEVLSEDVFGYIFTYPPNKVEYFRIKKFQYQFGSDCVPHDTAKIKITKKENDIYQLQLLGN